MADQSKVNIDALTAFAGQVAGFSPGKDAGGMLKDYSTGMQSPASQVGGAIVGFLGTNEAKTLQDWYYKECLESLNSFTEDVVKGLESLGSAAIIMAANYREGDLSQAQAMNDVIGAFNPGKGQQTVDDQIAAAQKKDPPKTTAETLPPPEGDMVCTLPTPGEPLTPQQQVEQHDNKYGDHEDWYPGNPNYDPMNHPQLM